MSDIRDDSERVHSNGEEKQKQLAHLKRVFHVPAEPEGDLVKQEDWLRLTTALKLSGRECAVAQLIFCRKSRKEIARDLAIKRQTVRVYIDRLFRKLGVDDRIGMVQRIIQVYLKLGRRQ